MIQQFVYFALCSFNDASHRFTTAFHLIITLSFVEVDLNNYTPGMDRFSFLLHYIK
jgi:hypothetical protein